MSAQKRTPHRRICFVTGTRAEFGLMVPVLRAIQAHPRLQLQIVATGMHLDRRHGKSVEQIRRDGWPLTAIVPWPAGRGQAQNVGSAIARLADIFAKIRPHIVLVVGDRVEALAGAVAGHLSSCIVAHVHGGDKALGQVDDALRHAITKLAHVHFPATPDSAHRLRKLGEQAWRIHRLGTPGIDGIVQAATPRRRLGKWATGLNPRRYALVLLHPVQADERAEQKRAELLLTCVEAAGFEHVVVIYPNNDPGAAGIVRAYGHWKGRGNTHFIRDLPRGDFLGLLRDAAMMVGNSSSGIIEAASFGVRVIDVGDRQLGRQKSGNVVHVRFSAAVLRQALGQIWNKGKLRRWTGDNVYGGAHAGQRIAGQLAAISLEGPWKRKLIAY
jgi:UDP-hydrolysing UDP-N-acetyl-D-glucosamine 2-epimerase